MNPVKLALRSLSALNFAHSCVHEGVPCMYLSKYESVRLHLVDDLNPSESHYLKKSNLIYKRVETVSYQLRGLVTRIRTYK